MSLVVVRQKFVEVSGRYDLVVDTTDWADNGADFYINAGQDYLDMLDEIPKSWSRKFVSIAAGAYYTTLTRHRAIKSVWASGDSDDRWELAKKPLDWLRGMQLYELPTSLDQGKPIYYSPTVLRTTPEDTTTITIDYFGSTEVTTGAASNFAYNALLFAPPSDDTYTLEVWGLFLSEKLSDDDDVTFWTEEKPHLLVWAACRALEATYRNVEGMKSWELAINSDVSLMGKDWVEEEIASISQMKG